MGWIVSFIVSVAANAVSNYVSRWLDRRSGEQEARHSKSGPPESSNLFRGPLFAVG